MIESYYWKTHLLELEQDLSKRKYKEENQDDYDAFIVPFEKDVIIGFMIIRRLIESKSKLKDSTVNKKFRIVKFERTNKTITFFRDWDISENYKLEKGHEIQKGLQYIANQFLHHVVMFSSLDDSGVVDSIFVTSDKDLDKCLYLIELKSIYEIFNLVGNDYPTQLKYIRTQKGYDVRSS